MSEQFKTSEPERYANMTRVNHESLYMTDIRRPFDVVMSFSSAGPERVMYNKFNDDPEIVAAGKAANRLSRFVTGGNMSTAVDKQTGEALYGPQHLTSDEKLADARRNMDRMHEQLGIDPAQVRILNPDRDYTTPLQVVNIDTDPVTYDGLEAAKLEGMGDMIYTYNPNIIMGVRPADCPLVVLSADTPKGRIYTMVHFAWQGAAADQVSDMQRELDALGVDLSTATVYMTPGGHAETFPFENAAYDPDEKYPTARGLFQDVAAHEKNGEIKYNFKIDTPNFVYEELLKVGLDKKQIFVDTTDTTSPGAGTASHSRSVRLDDDNGRDYVLVKLNKVESLVASNPERPTPPELEWQIIPIEVEYFDFEGNLQTGTIEVHRELYDFTVAFFIKALEMKFPINKVAKSSDPEFGWSDDKLIEANASSGFNLRYIAGTKNISNHGFGVALDVNDKQNPYIRYNEDGTVAEGYEKYENDYNPSAPGTLTADHPLVKLAEEFGLEWGG